MDYTKEEVANIMIEMAQLPPNGGDIADLCIKTIIMYHSNMEIESTIVQIFLNIIKPDGSGTQVATNMLYKMVSVRNTILVVTILTEINAITGGQQIASQILTEMSQIQPNGQAVETVLRQQLSGGSSSSSKKSRKNRKNRKSRKSKKCKPKKSRKSRNRKLKHNNSGGKNHGRKG